jgi:hypothetical protein
MKIERLIFISNYPKLDLADKNIQSEGNIKTALLSIPNPSHPELLNLSSHP